MRGERLQAAHGCAAGTAAEGVTCDRKKGKSVGQSLQSLTFL